MNNATNAELVVVGGGVVGAAIAYGACRRGRRVVLLDEGDQAFRAARGNFGLVWVQGKGADSPAYAAWTRRAGTLWPEFARRLEADGGGDLQLRQDGGLNLCLTDDELAGLCAKMDKVRSASDQPYPFEVLDRRGVRAYCPSAGPAVIGGIYCPLDGHVSPLNLLRNLFSATAKLGGTVVTGAGVETIRRQEAGFSIDTARGRYTGDRVVLAAGLGNARLAPQIGLSAPVRPVRGQVIVTERTQRFLDLPTLHVRQTGDGSIQIGDSKEDVGFDDGTSFAQLRRIAARAVRCFPALAQVNMLRAWGALRVMTADGLPIYQQSAAAPGAFVVSCHSGVTLAAAHADAVADWVLGGARPAEIGPFTAERFDVRPH